MIAYRMRGIAHPGEAIKIRAGVGRPDKKGRFKKARDYKTGWLIERTRASVTHQCHYMGCVLGLIVPGDDYATVYDPAWVKRVGWQRFPDSRRYHFDCLPEEAKPLVRFVR